MRNDTVLNDPIDEAAPKMSEWIRFRKVFFGRPLVIFGMTIIVFFVLMAIFAPWLSPYSPIKSNLEVSLIGPNASHWLGTDIQGRDTLSRIIYGSRVSLLIGITVVFSACLLGMMLGTLAGFYGGWIDALIMRIMDALMAFPMMILALMIASLLGSGILNVIIALGVASIPGYARVMYALVLSVKETDYAMASRSQGASGMRIMVHHIFPNCLSPVIVMITMMLGGVILAEAGLSFLGIGIKPPTAAWGSMVNDGSKYLLSNPIISFAPGIAIMLVVFSFNMVGDGLRDALDPRLRGTL
jgi:peptide/nickel transport system permease protein